MPKIDLMGQGDLIQDQVRGADIPWQSYGRNYEAAAQLGEQAVQLGTEVLKKRKEANDTNYAFNKNLEDAVEINRYSEDLKKSLPDGADGYADKMKEFVQERVDKNLEDAPSLEAGNMYHNEARNRLAHEIINSEGYESKERARKYRQDISDGMTELSAGQMNDPDPERFVTDSDLFRRHVEANIGTTVNPEEGHDIVKKGLDQFAGATMHGYESQGRYEEALNLLKTDNPVAQALNTEKREQFLEKFTNLQKVQNTTRLSTIHNQLMDMETDAFNGNYHDIDAGKLQSIISEARSNPKLDEDGQNRIIDRAKSLLVIGPAIDKLKTTPRDQWSQLLPENFVGSGFNSKGRQELQRKYTAAMNNFATQQEKYPAETTLSAFPVLQSLANQASDGNPEATQTFAGQLLDKEKALGIRDPKILTDYHAQRAADIINKAPTPEAAALAINSLQKSFGKYYPQAFMELAERESKGGYGVDPRLSVASFLTEPASQIKIVENVRNAKPIEEGFKGDHEALKLQINKAVSPAIAAINSQNSDGSDSVLANSVRAQVELEAKKLMNADYNMSAKEAAQRGYQAIIGRNFNLASGNKSQVLVPNQLGGHPMDSNLVAQFLGTYSHEERFKELDVGTPKSYIKGHESKADAQDAYYQRLADTGRWVSIKDGTGIKLVQQTESGYLPVLNSKNEPIIKSFQEISTNPPAKVLNKSEVNIDKFGFEF